MYSEFDTVFEEFLINIALTKAQAQRIDSSLIGISEYFATSLQGDVEIYTQGSFATNTITKPLTITQSPDGKAGEYDVDIVFERRNWGGAAEALGEVRNILKDSPRYDDLLLPSFKESCERIEYAAEQGGVGFHVDLVPINVATGKRQVALRTKDTWRDSDPQVIINWFNGHREANPYLGEMVLTLKRMRDVAGMQQTIPSIIILAMVGLLYSETGSYVSDLLNLITRIVRLLEVRLNEIRIPGVNENLADKWNDKQRGEVCTFFLDAYSVLKVCFDSNDLKTVQEVLSSDFPNQKYLEDLDSLRSKGWRLQLDGSLERPVIKPVPEPSDFNRLQKRLLKFKRKGQPVRFNATPFQLRNGQIVRWQVLNAPGSEAVRGDFFPAKNSLQKVSTNSFENHETVSYRGLHWIRYFVVDVNTMTVDIVSKKYSVVLDF